MHCTSHTSPYDGLCGKSFQTKSQTLVSVHSVPASTSACLGRTRGHRVPPQRLAARRTRQPAGYSRFLGAFAMLYKVIPKGGRVHVVPKQVQYRFLHAKQEKKSIFYSIPTPFDRILGCFSNCWGLADMDPATPPPFSLHTPSSNFSRKLPELFPFRGSRERFLG